MTSKVSLGSSRSFLSRSSLLAFTVVSLQDDDDGGGMLTALTRLTFDDTVDVFKSIDASLYFELLAVALPSPLACKSMMCLVMRASSSLLGVSNRMKSKSKRDKRGPLMLRLAATVFVLS